MGQDEVERISWTGWGIVPLVNVASVFGQLPCWRFLMPVVSTNTSHHLAVINVSLIPCIQHLQWGDVILSTYARTRYLGTQSQLPLQMLMSLEIPSKDYAYQWVMISGSPQRSSTYFTVWELHLHSFFFMVSTCYYRGYASFFTLAWLNLQLSAAFLLTTWSTVSKHFDAHQSLKLPKAQTKPSKITRFRQKCPSDFVDSLCH